MTVTIISYGTPQYRLSQLLMSLTAKWSGADKSIRYSKNDLERTAFYEQNKQLLDEKRGNGYWLWKPFFILETLKKLPPGDILIYADAGILFRKKMQPLLNLVKGENDYAFFYNSIRMKQYTKRDVFVAAGCDAPEYYEAPMIHAGLQVYRNTPESQKFVAEVLHFCTLDRLITDDASTCGLPEVEGFIENRHDQSIFSILIHKHRKLVSVDPSQFLVKHADFQLGRGDISRNPLPYNRIVYIHRYRNSQLWKLIPDTLRKLFS